MNTPNAVELGFHVMSKPTGPICNLRCAYCYYLEKEHLYSGTERWRMSDELLDTYTQQYIAAQPASVSEIVFGWQGGEPTLLGIDFFRRAVELQTKYTPEGKRCVNALQTNGILLDDDWCSFFKAHDFLVGISIDGPADLHDKYRRDKQGRPTLERVLQGLRCLKKHEVTFNALVCVQKHNGSHGGRVYRFLRDQGIEFVQLIPVVEQVRSETESEGATVTDRSVQPKQYGQFLIDMFDEWVRHDVGRVFVQVFDEALAAWMGQEPALCIFRRECGRAMALEHNGDLYSCDHFVWPEYKLGNIRETPMAELAAKQEQVHFGRRKLDTLPLYCQACDVRFVCNGGCLRNRFIEAPDGQPGLNYLCEGYRLFFHAIDPYMQAMAEELRNERPAANVMYRINAHRRQVQEQSQMAGQAVKRNDPCPCGSGKKFKACCMRA